MEQCMYIWSSNSVGLGWLAFIYPDVFPVIPIRVAERQKPDSCGIRNPTYCWLRLCCWTCWICCGAGLFRDGSITPGITGRDTGLLPYPGGPMAGPCGVIRLEGGMPGLCSKCKKIFINSNKCRQDGSRKRRSDIVLKLTIQWFFLEKQRK